MSAIIALTIIGALFGLCVLATKACDWLWFGLVLPMVIERQELVRVMQYVRQERGTKMTRQEIKAYKKERRG
jgi:type III secretory pathway component EscU